ncbi:MAG TPA: RidA family protein [Solirubrobacterales bacterium]
MSGDGRGRGVRREPYGAGLSISESVVATGPGSWIHLSGRIPLDTAGEIVTGPMREQAELCFAGIEAALAKVGAALTDVVKLTVFTTDLAGLGAVNELRTELLGDSAPASTGVEVAALYGGAQLEIEALAFLPEPDA